MQLSFGDAELDQKPGQRAVPGDASDEEGKPAALELVVQMFHINMP